MEQPDLLKTGDCAVVFLPANGDIPRNIGQLRFDGAVRIIANMEVSLNFRMYLFNLFIWLPVSLLVLFVCLFLKSLDPQNLLALPPLYIGLTIPRPMWRGQ